MSRLRCFRLCLRISHTTGRMGFWYRHMDVHSPVSASYQSYPLNPSQLASRLFSVCCPRMASNDYKEGKISVCSIFYYNHTVRLSLRSLFVANFASLSHKTKEMGQNLLFASLAVRLSAGLFIRLFRFELALFESQC